MTTDSGEPASPPEIPPESSRSPSASACEPFHELIEAGLSRGRNAMAIWQDLVDQSAFAGAYQSVKRYVRKLRGAPSPEPRAVILTAPGEEAQVDYGDGPMVRDPLSGKYRRVRLFVMTLGYSRKSVRLLTFASSSSIWCELHEKAFRRLGGTTRVVVLDNLREGVLQPDIYDPSLNPLYQDVLAHYGAVALACRVGVVHLDSCVEVGTAYCSAPPRWIGRSVRVQWNTQQVRLLDPQTGQLLREHLRQQRGRHRIHEQDRPSRTPLGTAQLPAFRRWIAQPDVESTLADCAPRVRDKLLYELEKIAVRIAALKKKKY